MPATDACLIDDAARAHRALLRRVASTSAEDVDSVLNLGAAVTLHGILEQALVLASNDYVAPAVVDELVADHERLREDLGLLEELADAESEQRRDDLDALSQAVMTHLQDHIERDDRLLYGSLQRASRQPPTRRTTAC